MGPFEKQVEAGFQPKTYPRIPPKEAYAKASELGKSAFRNGLKRDPARDKRMVAIRNTPGVVVFDAIDAWLAGWDSENQKQG